jgi:hypothetical protein
MGRAGGTTPCHLYRSFLLLRHGLPLAELDERQVSGGAGCTQIVTPSELTRRQDF